MKTIIVLLFISIYSFGQRMEVIRATGYDYNLGVKTVVKYPNYGIPIKSKINKEDLIALSIRVDSIIGNYFNAQIFVETKDSEKYKNYKLNILLDNGIKISLMPIYFEKGYIEYVITHLDTDRLSKNKIVSIELADNIKYIISKDYDMFFIEFFKIAS